MRHLLLYARLHHEDLDRAFLKFNLLALVVVMALCAWQLLIVQPH